MSGQSHHLQIVLVINNPTTAERFSHALTSAGHAVSTVSSVQEARATLRREAFDLLVTDAVLEGRRAGVVLADEMLASAGGLDVVVLAAEPDVKEAVALTRAGVLEYEPYPVSSDRLLEIVQRVERPDAVQDDEGFDEFLRAFMVSSIPAVQEMAAMCRTVASMPNATALIVGEAGAGKGVVSRIIHWLSPQSRAPMVRINLVDVDPFEVDRKLFGTGNGDDGLLAVAGNGTLLLREFSDVPRDVQPKLRKLLESRRYRPLDGTVERRFDGRLLATSTAGADALVKQFGVQPALAYRLATVSIRVPPLRSRVEDVSRITEAMLDQVAADAARPELTLSVGAKQLLVEHNWPGNLRELRNVLTRLALLSPHDQIDADSLARALGFPSEQSRREHKSGMRARVRSSAPRKLRSSTLPVPRISGLIAAALDDDAKAERERIEAALEATDGHRERAAAVLGMSRTTLWTRMRMLGIDYERFHSPKAKAQ